MSDQPQQQQIPADLPLSVTLTVALWRVVMTQLSEGAIKTCGPAFGEIDRQLQMKLQQQQTQPQQRSNGEARLNA